MKDLGFDKEVVVEVKGIQQIGEERDTTEILTNGVYYHRNKICYILYDEFFEENSEPVKNIIKITDSSIELTKKGLYNVTMTFDTERESLSYYNTPYGQMLIGISTEEIILETTDTEAIIKIIYQLIINGEHASDNIIEIKVRNRKWVV